MKFGEQDVVYYIYTPKWLGLGEGSHLSRLWKMGQLCLGLSYSS